MRALGCLGERDFPRFIEFGHLKLSSGTAALKAFAIHV
jgi:hypothetical protein